MSAFLFTAEKFFSEQSTEHLLAQKTHYGNLIHDDAQKGKFPWMLETWQKGLAVINNEINKRTQQTKFQKENGR